MALTLRVDTARWREHQESVLRELPGLVPVCKGNGYGFGLPRLAREAGRLGADLLAVGTAYEAAEVRGVFGGDLLVLTPPHRDEGPLPLPDRVIRTVSGVAEARRLAGARVVVKLMSSMRRHGVPEHDLPALRDAVRELRCEGFSLHLPLDRADGTGAADEVAAWIGRLRAAGLPPRTLFLSHLSAADLAALRERFPGTEFRLRVGTRLWLGGRGVSEYRADVLAVAPVAAGERFGERQRRARADGHLVVVSGGTAHGIGLWAPRTLGGVRPRLRHLRGAVRAAAGRHLSPYLHAGGRCAFAEPPHTHESVLFVPAPVPPPRPGETLRALVRYTTTRADRVADHAPAASRPTAAG
ncbi:alanine racemase [Streptomyces capparidis]